MASAPNQGRALTRKELLQAAAAGGLMLSSGALLAACGGGESGGETTPPPSVTEPAPTTAPGTAATEATTPTAASGGSLRVGLVGGSPADTLDPHILAVFPDWARAFLMYDSLTYSDPTTYAIVNRLAEEMTPNATGDVWTVRLKSGVEFHNGKTLGADDLIFSIQRMAANGNAVAPLYFVDPNGLKKLDDLTVEMTLKTPHSILPETMAASNEWIVPVDFDPQNPVGTGPFKIVDFKPGDRATMARHENYWGTAPLLDEVITIEFTDELARVNALLSGEVDAIQSVPYNQIPQFQDNPDFKLLVSEQGGGWNPFTMRIDVEPWSDVRVRQAMRLIVDREQMVQQAYLGNGRVANDLYQPFDPGFASDLPQRTQDLEQAKSLLQQAGYPDLNVELVTSPLNAGVVESSQVLVQQASEAGVTITLRQIDPGTFYSEGFLTYPFAVDTNISSFSYLTTVGLWDGGGPYDETHFGDPEKGDQEFIALYKQALETVDETARLQIQRDMQQIQYDRGGYIVWGFYNQVDAHSAKVDGFLPDLTGWPLGSFNFNTVAFV